MWAHGLSGMLSTHNNDGFLFDVVWLLKRFYTNCGDRSTHVSVSNCVDADFLVVFNGFKQSIEVFEVVGHWVGKLDSIVLDCKIVLKWQGFIVFFRIVFIIEIVDRVTDVETLSSPHFSPLFVTSHGSHARLHPIIIQRIWLVLSDSIHTRLTILNLATKLCLLFFTLKLNHCVHPPVLVSFCRIRS